MTLAATLLSGFLVPAQSREIAFRDLPGWDQDDHAAAFSAFRRSCEAPSAGAVLRTGRIAPGGLDAVCARARTMPPAVDAAAAKAFFERWFRAVEVTEPGFLTAYFEPVVPGAIRPSGRFTAPLLGLPRNPPSPLPDRAGIENGALAAHSETLVYLDPVDAFIAHIQGSVRVRIEAGRELRLAFAGRNGQPYTAIGRVLVDRGIMAREDVTMDAIASWLRRNPEEGREVMRENRSYIFFRIDDQLQPGDGPVGGAGVPLTPGRSLAVDRGHWPYALPLWIDATLPWGRDGTDLPVRRLTVAQDTGTAIVGPARADLFAGVGPDAGRLAGVVRHPMRMVALLPRSGERP